MEKKDMNIGVKEEKGFRKGFNKESLIKSLSDDELKRIRDMREADKVDRGSATWKVVLYNDPLRVHQRELFEVIRRKHGIILQLKQNIFRLKQQLASGNITEEIKPGLVMNENEVKSLIEENEVLALSEVITIGKELGRLRAVVGHIDYAREQIMTTEEFDAYVETVEKAFAKEGYKIFSPFEEKEKPFI